MDERARPGCCGWSSSLYWHVARRSFDEIRTQDYKCHVIPDEVLRVHLLEELTRRQLPSGGWATSTTSKQAALESACLAALALGLRSDGAHRVQDFLLRVQNPNGSWPAFVGDDPDGGWVTSLALIALRDYVPGIPARLRGFHWLLKFAEKNRIASEMEVPHHRPPRSL